MKATTSKSGITSPIVTWRLGKKKEAIASWEKALKMEDLSKRDGERRRKVSEKLKKTKAELAATSRQAIIDHDLRRAAIEAARGRLLEFPDAPSLEITRDRWQASRCIRTARGPSFYSALPSRRVRRNTSDRCHNLGRIAFPGDYAASPACGAVVVGRSRLS